MADLEPSVAHAQALADLAEAGLAAIGAALTCYRDEVPEPPEFPYVVFWSAPASPAAVAERMAGWGREVETVTQATVVGLDPRDVLGAVDRLARVLHRRRPSIPGRRCGDIEQDGAVARPDRDPLPTPEGRPVWTTVLFFRFMSSPTTTQGA